MLLSYIYWDYDDKEKCTSVKCRDYYGPNWDIAIEYHEKRGSPIEIIKYCKYGKEMISILNNICSESFYEEMLTIINSFIKEKDCLVKSKVIMAYMMAKYWIWECDFEMVYRDGVLRVFEYGIKIHLTKNMLNDMSQVFNMEAYDQYDNIIELVGR